MPPDSVHQTAVVYIFESEEFNPPPPVLVSSRNLTPALQKGSNTPHIDKIHLKTLTIHICMIISLLAHDAVIIRAILPTLFKIRRSHGGEN